MLVCRTLIAWTTNLGKTEVLVYFNMANGTAWCGRRTVTADIDGIVTHIGRQIINTSYAPDWVASWI